MSARPLTAGAQPLAPDDMRRLTGQEFRDVIGHFASGVTVITARHDGEPYGTTASAVSSLSTEPPMVLICLNKSSSTGRAVAQSGRYAINILAEDQPDAALAFATKDADKFRGVATHPGVHGDPLLDGALATLECRVVEEVTGGTHSVFLGEVDCASARTGAPLAYFRGEFGRLELAQDEQAFRDLRLRVLSRDLEVGVPLGLDDLAEKVGLPRGPVYHALVKLNAEGLVSRDRDGAFIVTPLTVEAVEKSLCARQAIELGVAAMTVGKLSRDRLAELRCRLEATRVVDDDTFDFDAYMDQYHAFHAHVISLAGSTPLLDAYKRVNAPAMILSLIRSPMTELGEDRVAAAGAFSQHLALVEAYEQGDLAAANRAIGDHIRYSLDVTRRYLDAAGGQI